MKDLWKAFFFWLSSILQNFLDKFATINSFYIDYSTSHMLDMSIVCNPVGKLYIVLATVLNDTQFAYFSYKKIDAVLL